MPSVENMEMGLQPMDALLIAHELINNDLVSAVPPESGLTHKVVQKARKGRALTSRAQRKVLGACNAALATRGLPPVGQAELFNYRGR